MSEFKRRSYSEEDKKKWEKVLTPEFMSSDESGTEDGKGVIFVKKIPWQSPKVETFFSKLDDNHCLKKSEQATRQTKQRIKKEDMISGRAVPANIPSWALYPAHQKNQ